VKMLILLVCVPVFGVASLGALHIIYDVRHVSFAVAPYYLLVARGITGLAILPRRVLIGLIAAYTTVSLRADYFIPYKQNYRDPMRILASESRPGDCLVLGVPQQASRVPVYWDAYYFGRTPPSPVDLNRVETAPCNRIWVPWEKGWTTSAGRYALVRQTLSTKYRRGPAWSFGGMDVDLYVPK